MFVYQIRAYNNLEEVKGDFGVVMGERFISPVLINVLAKTEIEALKQAKLIIIRKEYRVEGASPSVDNNQEKAQLQQKLKTTEENLEESRRIEERRHKDWLQMSSKANVLAERVALALEKIHTDLLRQSGGGGE